MPRTLVIEADGGSRGNPGQSGSGAVVIETVFSIRGLGRILVGAIFDRDYPIVQGVIRLPDGTVRNTGPPTRRAA